MDNNAKLRPWLIARILYERTDYDNYLTTAQLIKILEEECNMPTHRTTVGQDVELLQSLGMDIQVVKSTQNRYNVLDRYFLDSEIRLMIDAVASARFISASQSRKLVDKLSALAGRNAAERMIRNVSVERRIKGSNKKVLGIVDAINTAITQRKQITFQYFEYNAKKERKPRRNGFWYVFSPWRLVWNGDFYYVVGWNDLHGMIMNYRIDRIAATPRLLDAEAAPMPKGFDLDRYINTMHHMFSSERKRVELICDDSVMDSIIDRFGEGVDTSLCGAGHFRAVVEVAVNSVLFAWIVGFGGLVKIKGPEEVKAGYADFVTKAYEALEEKQDEGEPRVQ